MSARIILSAAALAVGFGSSNLFAAIPWTNPSGTSPNGQWTYSNGQSDAGLFGNPVVSNEGFTFFTTNFFAESENGVPQTTRDRLQVRVNAVQPIVGGPNTFVGLSVREIGDYSILGTGSVKATGLLTVTAISTLPGGRIGTTWTDTFDRDGNVSFENGTSVNDFGTTPTFPVSTTTSADGEWAGILVVRIPAGAHVTGFELVLNNVLQATSAAGGTSFIEKKVLGGPQGPGIVISFIPEPATLAAVGGAALLMLRRRTPAR